MGINRKILMREAGSLCIVILLVTFARSSLADHYYVPSGSMEPTLVPGDRIIVDKTAYGFRVPLTKIDLFASRTPTRGDIAVFDSPTDGTRLVKRVVAIGGDTVELRNGNLSINGQRLSRNDSTIELFETRSAQLELASGGGPDIDSFEVPEGQVLVLGDHRGNSHDGRYFGSFDERELFGRAVAIYYRKEQGLGWTPL